MTVTDERLRQMRDVCVAFLKVWPDDPPFEVRSSEVSAIVSELMEARKALSSSPPEYPPQVFDSMGRVIRKALQENSNASD